MTKTLIGLSLDELVQLSKDLNLPSFLSKQLCDWLYKKEISSINDMTNISMAIREKLANEFTLGVEKSCHETVSQDGTKKYLFKAANNRFIESAYIPDDKNEKRATLCLSTQIGCKMGCLFCMTAKQGFQGQLQVNEILNQYHSLPERERITNIVFMGMGEPLDNFVNVMKALEILTAPWGYGLSPKRITVSTVGILPTLTHFLEQTKVNLALSLHSPFDEERKNIMPIQNVYPIKEVIEAIRSVDKEHQRRVSFEYIVFGGMNDSKNHVKELARLLNGMNAHINLMRFHPVPNSPLPPTDEARLLEFKEALMKKDIMTTIRASRGLDVDAACGLLSTKKLLEQNKA